MKQSYRGNILVLDDEKNIGIVLAAILEKRGFRVETYTNGQAAVEAVRTAGYDAIVTDLYMPHMDGLAFLREVKRMREDIPVIVITAFGAVETAVDAMRSGAFDYVTKPFEQSEILTVVEKAVNTKRFSQLEVIPGGLAAPALAESEEKSPIIFGNSPGMAAISSLMEKIADTPSCVMVLGEAGTGKEFLVEEIHRRSGRVDKPLLRLNCAAIPAATAELELFGSDMRPGRLQLAAGGTIFLDEISELERGAQIRLAEFLSTESLEAGQNSVRVIAASNRGLENEVASGAFREDLWYRLNVVSFHLPPLRERAEDFAAIVNFLLGRLAKKLDRVKPLLDADCLAYLKKLKWPGNLRQLENILERMLLLADRGEPLSSKFIPEDLPQAMEEGGIERFREVVKRRTQSLEKDLIEQALRSTNTNITRAAEQLGLSRKGLQLKMKELGIR